MRKESITIVSAADESYALPLATMLVSLCENCSETSNLSIHILDGGIKKRSKKKILAFLPLKEQQIQFHSLRKTSLPHPEGNEHLTVATSYRFMIPTVLEQSETKSLYIDADTVITDDITKLWNIEVYKNFPCAAVIDSFAPRADAEYGITNYLKKGIAPDTPCLNAGVLLINLEKWRQDKISAKALAYIAHYKESMKLVSQEALNGVLLGSWQKLEQRWNQLVNPMPFYDDPLTEPPKLEPGVIHYITSSKPWHFGYPHPSKELFYSAVDKSGWQGFRPKGPSIFERILNRAKRSFA